MEDGYISRATAIAEMTAGNLLAHFDSVEDMIEYRFHRAAERVLACIPAADVVEVIHAYWIDENPEDLLDVRMRCSNCRTIHAPYAHWHYCPSCGAKMDGGQAE